MPAQLYGYDPSVVGLSNPKWVGRSEVMVACPFHGDRKPSLTFNVNSGLYYCFACGAAGTVKKLASVLGGRVIAGRVQPPARAYDDDQWHHLLDGPLALDDEYLQGRGVTNEQVQRYRIHRHPDGICLPLTDILGDTVGVIMRRREASNLRYMSFGEKPPLWPLDTFDEARSAREVVLTEGLFGVLAADRAGLTAMSVLGAAVKWEARRYLQQISAVVAFDDDLAGYIGAARVLKMAPLSQVIVPGVEADELDEEGWHDVMTMNLRTRSTSVLATTSGDAAKFRETLQSINRSFSRFTRMP